MLKNTEELIQFLESTEIPKIEHKPKTFLEIAKQPHFENVLSNIYAFFLNVQEEHGYEDLFVKSLLACIADKSSDLTKDFSSFTDFEIETEYPTKGIGKNGKRGRIDLLLYNNEQAIIIENKVYHTLNNDLDDYWNSVKLETPSTDSKIGIILSLKPISKDNWQNFDHKGEYINFTHLEFINKVNGFKSEYEEHANPHFHFVLADLIQNIQKISLPSMKKEDIQFFLENKEKINQLEAIKNEFRNHVISEVEKAGNSINNVSIFRQKTSQNGRLRYFQSKTHADLMYVVVFEELFQSSNVLHIIIEVRGNTLKKGEVFKTISFNNLEQGIVKDEFYKNTHATWAHFAHKAYEMEINFVSNLGDFILQKLKDDHFESIFLKLENFLKSFK
jgi:hypothetical protein